MQGGQYREQRKEAVEEGANDESKGPGEEANSQIDDEANEQAMAVYCKECQTWLNGPRQWADHKIGKKHRKNVQKARQGTPAGDGSVGDGTGSGEAPDQQSVDEPPAVLTAAWQWLEDGKAQKKAEAVKSQPAGDGEERISRSARRRRHKKEKELLVTTLDGCGEAEKPEEMESEVATAGQEAITEQQGPGATGIPEVLGNTKITEHEEFGENVKVVSSSSLIGLLGTALP